MLSQDKKISRQSYFNLLAGKSNKKAVSIMIGYVLLVTISIVMGIIIYQWIKTYVPSDDIECPEGVSLFIKQYIYDCNNNQLNLTLKNNGVFSLAGYFIYGSNKTDEELATIDLSNFTKLGQGKGGTVLLDTKNSFNPNEEIVNVFSLIDSGIGQVNSINIIPVRFQEEDNKNRFVSCGSSKIEELINCYVCNPYSCITLGYECGLWDNGCGGNLDCDSEVGCNSGEFCDSGTCGEIPTTCDDGLGTCDTGENCLNCPADCGACCGNGQCGVIDIFETCDTCPADCGACCGDGSCNYGETCGDTDVDPECNTDCGICCGNGVIDGTEECDDGDTTDGDGCSSTCTIETGWDCESSEPSNCYQCDYDLTCDATENCLCSDCENKKDGCDNGYMCQAGSCVVMTSIESCKSYCFYLGYDDVASGCTNNCGGSCTGTCESGGDQYCSSPTSFCCCIPY